MKSVRENSDSSAAISAAISEVEERCARRGERDPAEDEAWAYDAAVAETSTDLTPVVGANLRRLRIRRGLSLERLSKACGVSRAMLGQIELGRSAPTINVVWKIARALDIPFSGLISERSSGGPVMLRSDQAKKLTSQNGKFTSRALFPFDAPRAVEFYELRLAPRAVEQADPHPPGTVENIVVSHGTIGIDGRSYLLATGDALVFEAGVPHVYRNPADIDARMYLVMTYSPAP